MSDPADDAKTIGSAKRPITRVGAYALIIRDAEILLCRLSGNERQSGWWTLPGGGVDFGESVEAGAVREVLEETGFDVRLTSLLAVRCHDLAPEQGNADYFRAVQIVFTAEIVGGELTAEQDESTDLAAWVPLAAVADQPRVPLVDWALSQVRSR